MAGVQLCNCYHLLRFSMVLSTQIDAIPTAHTQF
jgi:hypothetical protein